MPRLRMGPSLAGLGGSRETCDAHMLQRRSLPRQSAAQRLRSNAPLLLTMETCAESRTVWPTAAENSTKDDGKKNKKGSWNTWPFGRRELDAAVA